MANLALLLDEAAAKHGTRAAIAFEGRRIDYAELAAGAARHAGLLRAHGVERGDRVAILLPNVPAFVEAYYGALRLGAVLVPINALLKQAEVRSRLADSGAGVVVAPPERAAELAGMTVVDPGAAAAAVAVEEIAEVDPDALAVLLYTSGTTGGPKGAELTHDGLRRAAMAIVGETLGLGPEDVLFGAAPLAHVFGQTGCMTAAIASGACLALVQRFEAGAALELIRETGVTVFLGVPTMCVALLKAAESSPEAPQFRIGHTGGAPLAVETLRAFVERFGGPVLEGYGMTETGGPALTHHLGQTIKPGSVGTPIEGIEARIAATDGPVGELLLRGPCLMRGYWNNEAATREAVDQDGWFATGDVGYFDEDGYLYLVDRKKDVILRGGYNVYPREVEEVLYAHPAVREAIVVGVPDPLLGEEVVALVVPRGDVGCEPEELKAYVRERIAAYKYPRLVVLVEDLPRGPSGKILRREVDREALRAQLDRGLPA